MIVPVRIPASEPHRSHHDGRVGGYVFCAFELSDTFHPGLGATAGFFRTDAPDWLTCSSVPISRKAASRGLALSVLRRGGVEDPGNLLANLLYRGIAI